MSILKKLSNKSKVIMTRTSVLDATNLDELETKELGLNESFIVLDNTDDIFLESAGTKEYKILTSSGIWHLTETAESNFAVVSDEEKSKQFDRGKINLVSKNGLMKIVSKGNKPESFICSSQNDIDSVICNYFEEIIKLEDVEDMMISYNKYMVKTINGDYVFLLLEKACFALVEVEPQKSFLQ